MIHLKNEQPSCHQNSIKIFKHALICTSSGWSKDRSQPDKAVVANSAAGNGKSENRKHIQRLSLVKSMCVLIHIKSGRYWLRLFSGLIVVTHIDNKSAIGLSLPGTWMTTISILKMAVISQKILAQVTKKGSLVLPVFNTSSTA